MPRLYAVQHGTERASIDTDAEEITQEDQERLEKAAGRRLAVGYYDLHLDDDDGGELDHEIAVR